MYKITNLYRLSFRNSLLIIGFYLRKVLGLSISEELKGLNTYYHMLIRINGAQIGENEAVYISKFKMNQITFKIRKHPSSDIDVLEQVFHYNQYQDVVEAYNAVFDNKSPNIIDAGANIGLASLFFKSVFKTCNLVAIEPETNNFKLLSDNINTNQIKAQLLNSGIWSQTTYLKIKSDFRNQNDWSFRVEETDDSSGGIHAITINDIVKNNSWTTLDILKIDIEGAEKEVFDPEKSNLDFLKITKCIAIEIHDEFNCRQDIYKILKDFGFKYVNIGELTIGVKKTEL